MHFREAEKYRVVKDFSNAAPRTAVVKNVAKRGDRPSFHRIASFIVTRYGGQGGVLRVGRRSCILAANPKGPQQSEIPLGLSSHDLIDSFEALPSTAPTTTSALELSSGITFRAVPTYLDQKNIQVNTKAYISYVTGSHAFKVGLQTQSGYRRQRTWANNELAFAYLARLVPDGEGYARYDDATAAAVAGRAPPASTATTRRWRRWPMRVRG